MHSAERDTDTKPKRPTLRLPRKTALIMEKVEAPSAPMGQVSAPVNEQPMSGSPGGEQAPHG